MRWSYDSNGAVAHVARDWQQFSGVTEDEIIGRSDRLSVHQQDRAFVSNIIRHAVELRQPFVICFRQQTANRDFAWVMAGASPSFSAADGQLLGYLGDTELLRAAPEPSEAMDILHRVPQGTAHQVVLLDAMADHISTARTLAKHVGDLSVKRILDAALLAVGDMLYQSIRR